MPTAPSDVRSPIEAPPVDPGVAASLGLGGEGRRRLLRVAWLLLAVLLATGAAWLWSRWRATPPVQYRTARAVQGELTVVVTATGTLQPRRSVEVGPQISGRVASVHADDNDKVTKGQVPVELDRSQLIARVTEAKAQLRVARAAVQEAKAAHDEALVNRERATALVAEHVAPQQQLDTARAAVERTSAALENASARVSVAQAALTAAETDLGWSTIRSPIDGVVLSRQVEPGQAVAAAFSPPVLFVIAEDLTQMEVRVDIDEADVGRVRPGQAGSFTVDAYPERTFDATVEIVRNAPRTVQDVVTYEAVLSVKNPELLLRPGMSADVAITTAAQKDVLLVPNEALRFIPPGQEETSEQRRRARVWLLEGEPPELRRVEVRTGASDGERTVLLGEALRPGAVVATGVVAPAKPSKK